MAAGTERWRSFQFSFLIACLGLQIGGIAAFMHHWRETLSGDRAVVLGAGHHERSNDYVILPSQAAYARMSPGQAQMHEVGGVEWVLPYRSFVLADGHMPRAIIYEAGHWYRGDCRIYPILVDRKSAFSDEVLGQWKQFACSQPKPPEVDTISKRFFAKLKRWLGR